MKNNLLQVVGLSVALATCTVVPAELSKKEVVHFAKKGAYVVLGLAGSFFAADSLKNTNFKYKEALFCIGAILSSIDGWMQEDKIKELEKTI